MEHLVTNQQDATRSGERSTELRGHDDSVRHCVNGRRQRKRECLLDSQQLAHAVVVGSAADRVVVTVHKWCVVACLEIRTHCRRSTGRLPVEWVPPPIPHLACKPIPVEEWARTRMTAVHRVRENSPEAGC